MSTELALAAESTNVKRHKSITLLRSFNNILTTIVSGNSKRSPEIRRKCKMLYLNIIQSNIPRPKKKNLITLSYFQNHTVYGLCGF